jgi:hypothetical protein
MHTSVAPGSRLRERQWAVWTHCAATCGFGFGQSALKSLETGSLLGRAPASRIASVAGPR